jgi:hypothetical protein
MYGRRAETASAVTCSMCPVSVSLSVPLAVSQILMVRSPEPVANHSLPGSKATERTQPACPEMTRYARQGACHSGRGQRAAARRATCADGAYSRAPPSAVGTSAAEASAARAAGVRPARAEGPASASAEPGGAAAAGAAAAAAAASIALAVAERGSAPAAGAASAPAGSAPRPGAAAPGAVRGRYRAAAP